MNDIHNHRKQLEPRAAVVMPSIRSIFNRPDMVGTLEHGMNESQALTGMKKSKVDCMNSAM